MFAIDAFKRVHGDRYDYSLVNYINNLTPVEIICPLHGVFKQLPKVHKRGGGCQICARESFKNTQKEVLERFVKVHGDRYNYDKVVYEATHKPVVIGCPIHGDFLQSPHSHMRGRGCLACANKRIDLEEFLRKAREVHGDKYDYSSIEEVNSRNDRVTINCPLHGLFSQLVKSHLNGQGCRACGYIKNGLEGRDTKETFKKKAQIVHKDKYNYSKVVYTKSTDPVEIICPRHGSFWQKPATHLQGCGCPACGRVTSVCEQELADFFTSKGYKVERNYKPLWLNLKHLDIFVPKLKLAVEYNGYKFHHSTPDVKGFCANTYKSPTYHQEKYDLCKENSINLVFIWDFEDISEWKELLSGYIKNPKSHVISFENELTINKGLHCYGKSYIKRGQMSKYNQENVVEIIGRLYPEVDTSDVVFTGVRNNIILHHPEYGTIERTPESIFRSKSLNFNGTRIKAKVSVTCKALAEIEKLISSYGLEYEKDYTLGSYKVSFYIPSLKYAINFNSTDNSKARSYNFNLWKAYNDVGITVFNIYDFYWVLEDKKPIILSKIKHGLGKDKRVYARNCKVSVGELSVAESKKFLNESHLEGAGFYYKNSKIFSMRDDTGDLVMVAVVGQFFEQGVARFVTKLSRIATKRDVTVIGGISKMAKAIKEECGKFHYLITLSSGGSSIRSAKSVRYIDPRYFWVSPELKYYHRNSCQKQVLEKNFGKPLWDIDGRTCTEKEYMEALGYVRVFDNGLAELLYE